MRHRGRLRLLVVAGLFFAYACPAWAKPPIYWWSGSRTDMPYMSGAMSHYTYKNEQTHAIGLSVCSIDGSGQTHLLPWDNFLKQRAVHDRR